MLYATAPEDPTRYLPLMIVLLLAFLVPILLARFQKLPVVVGEIIAGVIVGPSVLNLVGEETIFVFMADIGLAFLMFLAGIEIDFAMLFPSRGQARPKGGFNALRISTFVYLATLALAIPSGFLVRGFGLQGDPWLLAFVFSATSLGVLLPVLKERNMLRKPLGQVVFVTATLADFVTVILLTVYIITLDKGFEPEIFSLGLLFVAFLIFYRFGPQFVRTPAVRRFFEELSKATVQIKVRGAIAILTGFVVLAEYLEAELILGAFLAGMIISLLKGPEDEGLVHKLEAFGFGFFIPVFFILVGVDLDIPAVLASPESLLTLPGFLLCALAVKIIPMFIAYRHFSLREIFAGGLLLNTHLSLEIAVAVIGLRAGLFDVATSTVIILFAIVTVILMPFLFGVLLPFAEKIVERFTLLVGVNNLGIRVAQQLRSQGGEARFLDDRQEMIKIGIDAGFQVITEPANRDGIGQVDADTLSAVLVLGEDDMENYSAAKAARDRGVQNVVAMVREPLNLEKFDDLGVKPFTPAIQRATIIAMMAQNPDAFALFTSTQEDRRMAEMTVNNMRLSGIRLRDLGLPGDFLVLSVRRRDEVLIPRGNTVLEIGDRLTMLGHQSDIAVVRERLEGN